MTLRWKWAFGPAVEPGKLAFGLYRISTEQVEREIAPCQRLDHLAEFSLEFQLLSSLSVAFWQGQCSASAEITYEALREKLVPLYLEVAPYLLPYLPSKQHSELFVRFWSMPTLSSFVGQYGDAIVEMSDVATRAISLYEQNLRYLLAKTA